MTYAPENFESLRIQLEQASKIAFVSFKHSIKSKNGIIKNLNQKSKIVAKCQ
jgi:hypothetical protein